MALAQLLQPTALLMIGQYNTSISPEKNPPLPCSLLSKLFDHLFFTCTLYCVLFVCRNLLRPAGVQLQPATFKLKLYYAEDLPRSKSS